MKRKHGKSTIQSFVESSVEVKAPEMVNLTRRFLLDQVVNDIYNQSPSGDLLNYFSPSSSDKSSEFTLKCIKSLINLGVERN